jgi:hypothetical protein
MDLPDSARQRALRTRLIVLVGCIGLLVLGVLAVSHLVVATDLVHPAVFIVVQTCLAVLLTRRS